MCVRRGRGEARGQTHCRLRVGGWSAKRESVVAKAKHSLAACKRPNTESHLSVPARSMPTSAAVVRFRVARRVVATRTRRCVSRWPKRAKRESVKEFFVRMLRSIPHPFSSLAFSRHDNSPVFPLHFDQPGLFSLSLSLVRSLSRSHARATGIANLFESMNRRYITHSGVCQANGEEQQIPW